MERPLAIAVLVWRRTPGEPGVGGVSRPRGPVGGLIYRPAGPGPIPAFVLMHGCSGLWRADGRRADGQPTSPGRSIGAGVATWRSWWTASGRGGSERFARSATAHPPPSDRPRDAYAALAWLAHSPVSTRGRIHLQGWSNGGIAVLYTVKEGAAGRPVDGRSSARPWPLSGLCPARPPRGLPLGRPAADPVRGCR